MFEKLSDNLNTLMANARMNACELARKTGVPASTIKKIRNHNNPNPTLATLIPIAQNFAISVSQLVGDEGLTMHDVSRLPLLSWEQAVHWPQTTPAALMSSGMMNQYSEHSFALLIQEDNWEGFAADSVIIIDPTIKADHRDYILVHKLQNELPSLRQMLQDDGTTYLKPVVSGYQMSILNHDYRILGTVMEIRRILKNRRNDT